MDKETKEYWKDFWPLWWVDIGSWYGVGEFRKEWKKAMTSLFISLGIIYGYLHFEQVELAIENIEQFFLAFILAAAWFVIVAFISFVSANIKLHSKQKEAQKKKEKEVRNLKDKYEKAPVANPLIISAFNDEANQRVGIRLDNTSKTRRVSNIKIRLIGLDYESWGDGKTYPQIGTFSEDNRLFKEGNGFDDGVSISPLGHAFIYIAKNVDSELVLLLEKPEANKNLFREIIEEDRYIELIRKVHPSYLGWKQYLSIFIIEVSVMGDIDGKPTTENSFRDYLYFSHLLSDDNKSGLYRSSTRIMIGLENMYRKGLAFKYESKESENEEKDNPS